MAFLLEFIWKCKTFVLPFTIIIVAALVLSAQGEKDAARVVSELGTVLVLLANLAYIAFWRSRKNWPNTNWFQRLSYVLTFKR